MIKRLGAVRLRFSGGGGSACTGVGGVLGLGLAARGGAAAGVAACGGIIGCNAGGLTLPAGSATKTRGRNSVRPRRKTLPLS